jgi:subtilisin family serine protease
MPRVCLLLSLLLLGVPSALAQDRSWERDAQGLWQVEADGTRYAVDESVLSLAVRPGVDVAAVLAALAAPLDGATVLRTNRAGVTDLALPAGVDPLDMMEALDADPRVAFAEPATVGRYGGTPNDTSFGDLWYLHNTGQAGGTPGADLNAVLAWDITGGDPSVVVAVLDSGTELTHPDLVPNLFRNGAELEGNGLDDDGNGFVDDVMGWDFGNGDADPSGLYSHGTMVAGVVAAAGNDGFGVAGLAGGGDTGVGCRILPVAVGSFSPQALVVDDAIIYAADMGAKVITLSLSVGSSNAIDAAIAYAHDTMGVFIDCASGNNGSSVAYPARHADVVAVASTDRDDAVSSFSNAGPEVALAAPGEDLLMTTLGGGWDTSSGTSFAAPQVAALAALVFSVDPSLTPDEVATLLEDTARDVGASGFDQSTGHGRVDAQAALMAAGAGTPGQATSFGVGLAGVQGSVPVLSAPAGAPVVGGADFKLKLSSAKAGANAWLLIGLATAALPFKGGTLLVDVGQPTLMVPRTVSSVLGAPLGTALLLAPVPADPAFSGLALTTQWVVEDGAAPGGMALSNGMALVVGG